MPHLDCHSGLSFPRFITTPFQKAFDERLAKGLETEDYAYILFYHPDKVDEKGDVVFNTDLVKMRIDEGNAKKIFKEAVKVLGGDMPAAFEECGYCKWKECKTN